MATNVNKSRSFWHTRIVEPFGWLYNIVFHPFSFEKYINKLTLEEQKQYAKGLFLPFCIVSASTIIITTLVAMLFGQQFGFPLAISISFLVGLGYALAQESPAKRVEGWVTRKLLVLILFAALPLLITWFSDFLVILALIDEALDTIAVAICVGTIFGFVFGVLINSVKPIGYRKILVNVFPLIFLAGGLFELFLASFIKKSVFSLPILFFVICFTILLVRVRSISWLRTNLSINKANRQSIAQPERSIEFLKASRLSKDEFGLLPYPRLEATLRRAALYDWQGTRDYLAWLIDERPYQAELARRSLTEYIVADLRARKNILDIAGAGERLAFLLPDSKILQNEILEKAFQGVALAAELAGEYCRKFGVNNSAAELEYIISGLEAEAAILATQKRSRPHRAVYNLIKDWQNVMHNEIARVKSLAWQTP